MKARKPHFVSMLLFVLPLLFAVKANALYTPQEGISDLLSEELKFVGSYIPKYSISQKIPVCVFKNSKVLVKYTYCVSYSIPAGAVTIYSKDPKKGSVNIYAETESEKEISKVERSDYYEMLWYMASKQYDDTFDFDASISYFKKYDENDVSTPQYSGCVTAQTLADRPHSTACLSDSVDQLGVWGPKGYAFWQSPGSDWYKTLKLLKAKVPKTQVDGSSDEVITN